MDRWFDVFHAQNGSETTKVVLYDDIGAWGKTAKDFIRELDAIKSPKIDLHINSSGGEVIDGFACYNAIKGHAAEVTTHIDGVAASIASVIALAGDEVHMAKNAFLMIHNPWGLVVGDPAELRKQADVLDKMCVNVAQTYADKTGKSIEEVRKAMDAETWFNCTEAQDWGLVDAEDEKADENKLAASALLAMNKYRKVPAKLRKFAARLAKTEEQSKGTDMDAKSVKVKFQSGAGTMVSCPHCNKDINLEVDAPVQAKHETVIDEVAAKAAADKAREEGMAAGRKAEAEYRTMFNTVVATAKLEGAAAADFEKQFYGRSEADLKFLASHAIGQRAQAVGETGVGNSEGETQASAESKAEKEIEDKAVKRFADTVEVRRMFGLSSSIEKDNPAYQAACKRYVAREKSWAKDAAKNGNQVAASK